MINFFFPLLLFLSTAAHHKKIAKDGIEVQSKELPTAPNNSYIGILHNFFPTGKAGGGRAHQGTF